jgi:pimeloyl-ACP methyl ester carboxylesterase
VGDRRLWDGLVDALAERYRVVRPDLRGFGDSPLPGGPFSHVEDVRALLDELGIESAAVVANSFGGRIALDLALVHPGRVRALVLVSPALTGFEGSPELDAFDEEEDALLDAGRIDDAVELNLRTWLDGYGRDAAPVAPETRARVAAMQRQSFVTIVAAYGRTPEPGPVAWADPPAAERLDEISAPTLVVSGTHDHPDFRRLAERVAAGLPDVETAALEAGHLPGVERPDELATLLLGFLARRD